MLMLNDLRIAARTLAKNPVYSALAVTTLALGIAASTAMFTVVDGILLKPLPYPDPERIVNVYPTYESGGRSERGSFSYPELEDVWRDGTDVLDGLAMAFGTTVTLRPEGGEPERLRAATTTASLFSHVLRAPVRLGRTFTREDEVGRQQLVLLSESFWRERYQSDPAVLGQTIRLGSTTQTIVGVLAGDPTLGGPRPLLWTLMQPWQNRGDHRTNGLARLRDGVTAQQASATISRIIRREAHDHDVVISSRKDDLVSAYRRPLWILGAASFLLLVIAAGNVAALHLGRLIDRQGELAVRRALGAGGRHLATQVAAEGFLLSVASVALAMPAGRSAVSLLTVLVPAGLPRVSEVVLDGRILALGIAVTLVVGIGTSLLPLGVLRRASIAGLIGTGRGSVKGRSALQGGVIVGQIALATVLLYGAGLMSRTLSALSETDPGFAVRELMSFSLSYAPDAESGSAPTPNAPPRDRTREVADLIAAIPGVRGVAISDIIPLGLGRGNNDVSPEGYTGPEIVAERRFVSGEFFEVTGIRMIEGRALNADDDREGGPDHMVISASLARRAWPGQSAIGKKVSFWGQHQFTVVGVAEDLRDMQLRAPTEFTFYVTRGRMQAGGGNLLVRSDNPAAMTQTIRRRLQEAYPGVAFIDAGPMTRHIETAVANERFRARLTRAFALCAVIFCTLGIYGVVTRGVASRTREFGIRMALGADRAAITRGVLRQGLAMAVMGGAWGILLAIWGTQFLRAQLFGVGDIDGVTLAGVAGLLAAIALAATVGPAWRASHVEPTVALRSE